MFKKIQYFVVKSAQKFCTKVLHPLQNGVCVKLVFSLHTERGPVDVKAIGNPCFNVLWPSLQWVSQAQGQGQLRGEGKGKEEEEKGERGGNTRKLPPLQKDCFLVPPFNF